MSKTLVIILSETRGHELTYESFKKNVIDELDADLCLCIGIKKEYDYNNPFFKLAKYHFLYNEEIDPNFAKSVDYSYSNTDLSEKYEKIENITTLYPRVSSNYFSEENVNYLGEYNNINDIDLSIFPENDAFVYHNADFKGSNRKRLYSVKFHDDTYDHEENVVMFIQRKHYYDFLKFKKRLGQNLDTYNNNEFSNFTISTYIHFFFLWFLNKNLKEKNLIQKYDRFIITRSDFIYQLPFPKMDLLHEQYVWVPDSEDYEGLCDRCVVLSKYNIENSINILENFYKKSNKYYFNIQREYFWNVEKIFKMHLEENGLIYSVKRFPYINYLVRNIYDKTRWSEGVYYEELGYYIKYQSEYEKSKYYKNLFEKSGLSINEFYKQIINL